jgi:glycosyltransferase involved in cell wall biosynthesis
MGRMPRVDIVIPVYNEERDLPRAIDTLRGHLDGWQYDWRLVIADNASTDRTQDVGQGLAADPRVEYVRIPRKGRGGALRQVWLAGDADIMAYMDVDLSTGLDALSPLVDAIANDGYDLSTGSRNMAASQVTRSPGRRILTWGYNLILRTVLRVRFSDAQCGFKAVSREAAQRILPLIEDNNWFFDTELLILAEKMGYRVKDIPVEWVEDTDTRVKIGATVMEDLRGLVRLRTGRPWRRADGARGAPERS